MGHLTLKMGWADDTVVSLAGKGSKSGLIALWMALVLSIPRAFLTLTNLTLTAWLN